MGGKIIEEDANPLELICLPKLYDIIGKLLFVDGKIKDLVML